MLTNIILKLVHIVLFIYFLVYLYINQKNNNPTNKLYDHRYLKIYKKANILIPHYNNYFLYFN